MPRMTTVNKKKHKGRFSIVYRRSTHDVREYGTNPYIPHFLDMIGARCRPDRETLARVHIDSSGRYRYYPSKEYIEFRNMWKMKITKKGIIMTNEGRIQGTLW